MPYKEDIPGYMTRTDFKAVEALAACIPPKGILVEIGSYYGKSSWAWAHSVHPTVKVFCIDPWEGSVSNKAQPPLGRSASIEEFLDNVKDCPNIVPIKGFSPTMQWDSALRPDLVFVDGNHKAPHVNNDLAFWSSQLHPFGILCGHDFNPWAFPDVCEAAIQCSKSLNKPLRIFDGSTIWYIEMGRENFHPTHYENFQNRIFLEDLSWELTPEKSKIIRSQYPVK